ncbi:MAG: hypothetical protein R2690_18410 [Acidimicrobiales bacterium]
MAIEIDGTDVRLRYADVVVVRRPESDVADWEAIVVSPLAEPTFAHGGAYTLSFTTLEGRRFAGPALLVRSVEGTSVFRGAGELVER